MEITVSQSPISSILITLFFLLALVGRWNVFEKNKKAGWKAIVPFYNDKVYGDISGCSGLGIADMILGIIPFVISIILFFWLVSFRSHSIVEYYPEFSYRDIPGGFSYEYVQTRSGSFGIFLLSLLFIVTIIAKLIVHFLIRYKFNKKNNKPQWWMLFWVFLPKVPEIYFGLIEEKMEAQRPKTTNSTVEASDSLEIPSLKTNNELKEEISKDDILEIHEATSNNNQ